MPSLEDIKGVLASFGSFLGRNVEVKNTRLSCDYFLAFCLDKELSLLHTCIS